MSFNLDTAVRTLSPGPSTTSPELEGMLTIDSLDKSAIKYQAAFKLPSTFVESSDLTMMSTDESSQVHAKPRELFAEEKKAGPPPFMKEYVNETTGIYEIAFFRQRNRGFRQFVSAQKARSNIATCFQLILLCLQIVTIGDLCQLTEQQIAKFPLSNPVSAIRSAIREHFAKV